MKPLSSHCIKKLLHVQKSPSLQGTMTACSLASATGFKPILACLTYTDTLFFSQKEDVYVCRGREKKYKKNVKKLFHQLLYHN